MSFSKTNQMIRHITLLLFIGLAWGQNKVNIKNLVQYGDKMFEQNEDKPYTGRVFDLSKSTGEKILDGWYRDGKKSGRWTYFTIEGNGKYKLNYDNVSIGYKDYIENFSDYTQEYGKGVPTSGEFIDQFGKRYKGRLVLNEDDIGIFKKQDGSYLELKSLDDFSYYPKFYFSVKNDMIHGLTIVWHDNGFKEREGKIVDGEMNGLWNFWYENGSKKEEGNWIYGQNKKKEGQNYINGSGLYWYENEEKDGLWTYYTKKGNGKYKVTYEKGNITTGQYIDNLGNKYKGEFVSSKDEKEKNNGSFIIQNSYNYDFTIQPNKLISYKNGKEDGLLTTWYENGHKSSEGYMNEGIENGIWTFYYENGFEKYKIKYNNGIPFGELLWWTESGEKQKTDDFVTFYRKLYLHNDLLPIMRRLVSRKNDRSPKIQYQIGDIYLNDYKDYEKAIEEYQKVIRMFPGTSQEPESLFMIGYIYSNILNDLGSGMEIYKKFLKKFPKHELTPTVKFELEFLGVSIENIPDREIVTESKFSTHVDTKDSTTPAEKGGYGL